jgi:Protein of unknown function (DUF3618)/DUF883 C-terminal glycine zipper region
MVDTTDAVRRDIEMTRERMSTTLAELEQRMNVMQRIRDNPWPAIGIAVGAGVALGAAGSRRRGAPASIDVAPTSGRRLRFVLDGILVYLLRSLRQVAEGQIDSVMDDLRTSLRKPVVR